MDRSRHAPRATHGDNARMRSVGPSARTALIAWGVLNRGQAIGSDMRYLCEHGCRCRSRRAAFCPGSTCASWPTGEATHELGIEFSQSHSPSHRGHVHNQIRQWR